MGTFLAWLRDQPQFTDLYEDARPHRSVRSVAEDIAKHVGSTQHPAWGALHAALIEYPDWDETIAPRDALKHAPPHVVAQVLDEYGRWGELSERMPVGVLDVIKDWIEKNEISVDEVESLYQLAPVEVLRLYEVKNPSPKE